MMRRVSICYYLLLCVFFISITGCGDSEQSVQKPELQVVIKNDFEKRYPSGSIASFLIYRDNFCEIKFLDEDKNEAIITYVDEVWKITHTKIKDIDRLPSKVQKTFESSEYRGASILDVYRTDRDGIERSLYTLHFQFPWKDVEKLEHHVFINDDGLYLGMYSPEPNNPVWWANLPTSHFDFIAKRYEGAEIRGYINNWGSHEYFVLHKGVIKHVFFTGLDVTERVFWEKTEYELDINTKIPDNVSRRLKSDNPEFSYTNVYYIEGYRGDAYLFVDENHPNNLGHNIPIDVE